MTPRILRAYSSEHQKIEEEKIKLIDYTAWRNGLYVMKAVAVCVNDKNKYPERPYGLKNDEQIPDGEIGAIKFGAWANAFNKGLEQKKGGAING